MNADNTVDVEYSSLVYWLRVQVLEKEGLAWV